MRLSIKLFGANFVSEPRPRLLTKHMGRAIVLGIVTLSEIICIMGPGTALAQTACSAQVHERRLLLAPHAPTASFLIIRHPAPRAIAAKWLRKFSPRLGASL